MLACFFQFYTMVIYIYSLAKLYSKSDLFMKYNGIFSAIVHNLTIGVIQNQTINGTIKLFFS